MRLIMVAMSMIPLVVGCEKEEIGTCEDELSVIGQLSMGDTTFSINESLGNGLRFYTEHKVDVDLFEAGCVSDIKMEIEQGGAGCLVDLEFEATGSGSFVLSSFSFTADSYCPNFPDELEGSYTAIGGISTEVKGLPSQVEMETGTEREVCLDDIHFGFKSEGEIQRSGDETERSFELILELYGDHWSIGSTSADCEVR